MKTALSLLGGDVFLPGFFDSFLVRDHFKFDLSLRAKVKIGHLNDAFREFFLPKLEKGARSSNLGRARLDNSISDESILELIEGRTIALVDLWEQLLMRQPNGEEGFLLVNGKGNIFYSKDVNGKIWVIVIYWHVDSWIIGAYPLNGPGMWPVGSQVIFSA